MLISRGRQQVLLGRLALSVNTAVPQVELIDMLWPDRPPESAAQSLYTFISRLRSMLQRTSENGDAVISRTPAGYQLNLAEDQIDLAVFRRTVRAAVTSESDRALNLLETAATLWRSAPLSDVPQLQAHPIVTSVVEERIAMTLRHADLALGLGKPGRSLPALREVAAAHPLHEPVHARLVSVLAAENRQADALNAYTAIRQRLVVELGIEPGPELAEAHRRVLLQEPTPVSSRPAAQFIERPGPTVGHSPNQRTSDNAGGSAGSPRTPRCLPSCVSQLVGRDGELARACDSLGATDAGTQRVLLIDGMAGVGKSAFAVALAHRVRAEFAGAHLFVDLQGYSDATRLSTHRALGLLLGQLLPSRRIPKELPDRLVLWRTEMAEQRGIVVLDNVAASAQIEPLLGGLGPSLVLVTSRTRLGLIDGAWSLALDPLEPADAVLLLRECVGDRIDREPASSLALAELCGRLPLALRLVAHRLHQRSLWSVQAMTEQFCAADPSLLTVASEGLSVRGAFAASYRQLTAPQRRLFRLLGLHPTGDFKVLPIAALADLPHAAARDLLDELVEANLVLPHAPGRYSMHNLLREFAASLVETHEREPAITRMGIFT